jgi:hypothetical protein
MFSFKVLAARIDLCSRVLILVEIVIFITADLVLQMK